MKTWPEGLATITVKWDDGSELSVKRVKVESTDLELALDGPLVNIMMDPYHMPPPITKGTLTIDHCEMVPDDQDCFYEFKAG